LKGFQRGKLKCCASKEKLRTPAERVSIDTFEAAIEQAEHKLGLDSQPRAVVFHEKEGRHHAKVVWL